MFLCAACAAADGEPDASSGDAAETSEGGDDETTDDDGPQPGDDSTGADADTGVDETTTAPGEETGGETTGDAPLMGDVWVDAEGAVLGLYRVVPDDDGDAIEGLITADDITWQVSEDHTVVYEIDGFGVAFYESTDCTGPVYLGEVNTSWGSFRENVVTSAIAPDYSAILFAVPPGAERVEIEFQSWVDGLYGCLNFEVGFYDNAPSTFYAETDVVLVETPEFVPPLVIEHH